MPARIRKGTRAAVCTLFLLLLAALKVGFALAQTPQRIDLPFARGEQLLYHAELNRGLLRGFDVGELRFTAQLARPTNSADRKSTRLNSSHQLISYAVF